MTDSLKSARAGFGFLYLAPQEPFDARSQLDIDRGGRRSFFKSRCPVTEKDNKETRAAIDAAEEVRAAAQSNGGAAEADDDYHEVDFSKLAKKAADSPASGANAARKPADDPSLPPLEIEHEGPAQSWKLTLVILSASAVLMSLSYTMLIPFLPMYLIQELHVAQDDVNLWSGLIFSVSFLVSGIMAPIWGSMADKGSRKLMAVRSAFLLAISYGLSGFVQDEWQLLGVRCFQGFAAGLWPACLAILSSTVPKEKLGISLGTMQGAMTAGVVQLTILLQQPVMPLYVAELQGSMDRIVFVTGLLFSIVGISGVIASPVWGIVGQRIGFRPALYIALLGSGVFGMIQAIPDTLVPFGAWRFVGGLAFAGIFPAINALLTNSSGPEDRGRIFGLSFAAQQAGSVLGPILGGALAMFMSIKIVIFVSGFVLIPLVAFLYLKRPAVETSMKGVEVKFDRH